MSWLEYLHSASSKRSESGKRGTKSLSIVVHVFCNQLSYNWQELNQHRQKIEFPRTQITQIGNQKNSEDQNFECLNYCHFWPAQILVHFWAVFFQKKYYYWLLELILKNLSKCWLWSRNWYYFRSFVANGLTQSAYNKLASCLEHAICSIIPSLFEPEVHASFG